MAILGWGFLGFPVVGPASAVVGKTGGKSGWTNGDTVDNSYPSLVASILAVHWAIYLTPANVSTCLGFWGLGVYGGCGT